MVLLTKPNGLKLQGYFNGLGQLVKERDSRGEETGYVLFYIKGQ